MPRIRVTDGGPGYLDPDVGPLEPGTRTSGKLARASSAPRRLVRAGLHEPASGVDLDDVSGVASLMPGHRHDEGRSLRRYLDDVEEAGHSGRSTRPAGTSATSPTPGSTRGRWRSSSPPA